MVDKVIKRYLDENKRLVVPEFGAFIRKDGDGTVVFVEFLKKDDDVLLSLLRREYNLNRSEATALLEKYIGRVQRLSGRPGGYVIEGVGVMRRAENGVYDLEYDPQAVAIPEVDIARGESEKEDPSFGSTLPHPVEPVLKNSKPADDLSVPDRSSTNGAVPPVFSKPAALNRPEKTDPAQKADTLESAKEEPAQPQAVGPAARMNAAPDTPGRPGAPDGPRNRPAGPGRPGAPRQSRKKTDMVVIIAIIAAILAIIAMIYSAMSSSNPHLDLWNDAIDTVRDSIPAGK